MKSVGAGTRENEGRGGIGRTLQPQGDCAAVEEERVRERAMLKEMSSVRWIARRIYERLPQHVEIEDLISAGTIGLLDAYAKFDPAKNVQFRSYAQFRIR